MGHWGNVKKKKISRCWVEPRKLEGVLSSIKTTSMGKPNFFWEMPGKHYEDVRQL